MTYSATTANAARRDISKAARYISEKLYNPSAADRLLDEVEETIISLEEMPHRHPLVKDEYLASKGIRLLPIRNYHAFYTVDEESKTVIVVRFLYSKRDWAAILKGDYISENT